MKRHIAILISIMISILVLANIVVADVNDTVNDTNNTNLTNATMANVTVVSNGTTNTTGNETIVNETKVSVKIDTEYLEYDKENNADKILVTVTSDRLGNFKYIENYYMKNVTGQAKFYVSQEHFKTNLTENTISFNILRPTRSGEPYPFVRAIFVIDNKVVSKKWISNYESRELRGKKEEKKSPGFESILSISLILVIYMVIKKNK